MGPAVSFHQSLGRTVVVAVVLYPLPASHTSGLSTLSYFSSMCLQLKGIKRWKCWTTIQNSDMIEIGQRGMPELSIEWRVLPLECNTRNETDRLPIEVTKNNEAINNCTWGYTERERERMSMCGFRTAWGISDSCRLTAPHWTKKTSNAGL